MDLGFKINFKKFEKYFRLSSKSTSKINFKKKKISEIRIKISDEYPLFFFFFLEKTILKDQMRIRIQCSYTQLQSEPLNLSRHRGGFIHLNSRRRMRMLVGRSMRKWRWCLVKCAMACKPCKSATCRGSLMIASPAQREIASGHLYLCALLISPCNSSPFRTNLNVFPFETEEFDNKILR